MTDFTIVRDTREQKPLSFEHDPVDVVDDTLDTGDYSVQGYEDTFAIERKSGDDLCLSLGVERERFEREMVRSTDLDKFKVMIECPRHWFYDFLDEPESPYVYSSMTPRAVVATIDSWTDKYDCRFRWAGSREQAALEIVDTFSDWLDDY